MDIDADIVREVKGCAVDAELGKCFGVAYQIIILGWGEDLGMSVDLDLGISVAKDIPQLALHSPSWLRGGSTQKYVLQIFTKTAMRRTTTALLTFLEADKVS